MGTLGRQTKLVKSGPNPLNDAIYRLPVNTHAVFGTTNGLPRHLLRSFVRYRDGVSEQRHRHMTDLTDWIFMKILYEVLEAEFPSIL